MQWETYGLRIGSRILTNSGVGDIIFTAGADSEKMRILASGGITFNGDTATANALDDYEEGTFTASLTTNTTAPTTVPTTTASYVKVGSIVHIMIYFANVDLSGATGTVQITGLPFAINGVGHTGPAMKHVTNCSGAYNVWYNSNGTTLTEYYMPEGVGGWTGQAVRAASGQYYNLNFTYKTAS
jgi:hypothetical protein